MVDGKADPALVEALDDRVGIRRAVAAVTLRRAGIADHFAAVQKLLLDQDIEVRRRVALGLAEAGDVEGAVALSGLLENLPDAQAWEIEEQLERLAGGKVPVEMTAVPIDWKKRRRACLEAMVAGATALKIVMAEPLRGRLEWNSARLHAACSAAEQYDYRVGLRRQAALDSDRASRPH